VAERAAVGGAARLVVATAAVALLLFGVWPNRALDLARSTGRDLNPMSGMTIGLPR
jgi:hypothetical protein